MAAHPFRSHICGLCTCLALGPPPCVFLPLCVSGGTLARNFPRLSFPSAQRIAPPLTLVDAQRLQRVGLRVLQRGRICNTSWYGSTLPSPSS